MSLFALKQLIYWVLMWQHLELVRTTQNKWDSGSSGKEHQIITITTKSHAVCSIPPTLYIVYTYRYRMLHVIFHHFQIDLMFSRLILSGLGNFQKKWNSQKPHFWPKEGLRLTFFWNLFQWFFKVATNVVLKIGEETI